MLHSFICIEMTRTGNGFAKSHIHKSSTNLLENQLLGNSQHQLNVVNYTLSVDYCRGVKRGQTLEAEPEAEAKFKEAAQNNVLIEYLT